MRTRFQQGWDYTWAWLRATKKRAYIVANVYFLALIGFGWIFGDSPKGSLWFAVALMAIVNGCLAVIDFAEAKQAKLRQEAGDKDFPE